MYATTTQEKATNSRFQADVIYVGAMPIKLSEEHLRQLNSAMQAAMTCYVRQDDCAAGDIRVELINYCPLTPQQRCRALHNVLIRFFRELGVPVERLDLFYELNSRSHRRMADGTDEELDSQLLASSPSA